MFLQSSKEYLYEILKDLIRFPTENPPGNEAPAQHWFAGGLCKAGADVDIFEPMPGRPNVVDALKGIGNRGSVILNGHMNVVEARHRESWQHDPFEPDNRRAYRPKGRERRPRCNYRRRLFPLKRHPLCGLWTW